jgi:hypothetical protein
MKKGQKQAVVEMVQQLIPNFNLYKDIALVMLTKDQLEYLKSMTGVAMIAGDVEYGKDRTNSAEVYAYARSMVMNHLKKARELNGNQIYGVGPAVVKSTSPHIDESILSEELKDYVQSLYNR